MNPNWARWIFASTTTVFEAGRGTLKFYVEGTDMSDRRNQEDYAEFRMNGPFFKEVSRDYWQVDFEINVLVSAVKGKDFHKIHKHVGTVAGMFVGSLPIRCLGSEPDDDPKTILECAVLDTEGRDGGIFIQHFGQFDPTLPIVQATVQGTYRLYLQKGATNVQQNEQP